MNQLHQITSQILKSQKDTSTKYNTLLDIIKTNDSDIASKQLSEKENGVLTIFLLQKTFKPTKQLYAFLKSFIEFIYNKKSKLQNIIYQVFPNILCKYIQKQEEIYPELESCIRLIYNYEYPHFNNNLISNELLLGKSGEIGNLYKTHLYHSIKTSPIATHLNELKKNEQITSNNRQSIKCVMLLSIYDNLEVLTQKAIVSYLWCIYVYCGGTQQDEQTGVSLYLLEKKNMFSIFKYYISIEEMSIIILTLYQMSMQRKKNKFQLLSAINMIHKKAANQSLFKLSEVSQSVIHLLEDEYADAFS